MKKNVSLIFRVTVILLILIFDIHFQMDICYASKQWDSGAPEGAYTDSGSEQRAKEKEKEAAGKTKSTEQKNADEEEDTVKSWSWDDIFKQGEDFIKQGSKKEIDLPDGSSKQSDVIDPDNVKTASDSIFRVLLTIGIVLTVIIGAILGIKFMMSSVEEKAKVKEVMIPYVCGCAVIYGAVIIWKIITDVLASI